MHRHRRPRPSTTSGLAPVDLAPRSRARGPAARTPPRPPAPSRACAPGRTDGPSSPRHPHRAHQRAADGSAWRYAAASAARSDPPQATHRSPPETGQASAPAGPPASASPAAPRDASACLHRPSMNPMPDRQPPDREALPIPVPSDLLELFHSGFHSSVPSAQRSDERPASGHDRTLRWGQFKTSQWGQFRASFPASAASASFPRLAHHQQIIRETHESPRAHARSTAGQAGVDRRCTGRVR